MYFFLQLFVSGLSIGFLYGLSALGFVMIFKSSSVLNFAHGELLAIGAFLFLALVTWAELPIALAFLVTLVGCFLMGFVIERLFLRPLIGEPLIFVEVALLPDLPGAVFEAAFAALGHHQAVIGPTLDGGYYLIGFHPQTFLPAVFQTIPWGTTRVLAETLAVFRRHGLSVHQLPVWRDIDDLDDLIAFARRPFGAAAPARRTREVLAGLDLEGRKVPPVT